MKKIHCLLFVVFLSAGLFAQTSFTLKVTGEVASPLQLTLQDLAAMPHTTVVMNDKDGNPRSYSGVPLSAILSKAGAPTGKALHGENLSKY